MAKLAQEITDEFLTCKICLESYKNPKCLNCLHTFCEQCIENHVMSESTYKKYSDYREFTCPLCRKRTQLPLGGVKKLPDNFLVSNLTETIGRQRPSKFPFCEICKLTSGKRHREAQSKCLDCNKLLCKQCVDLHKTTKVTKSHNVFDVEIEKDIDCKEHPEEVVRFYCEPCEACICVLCTFNEHKEHDISSFNDAVQKYKENIENLLRNCQDKIDDFEKQLIALGKCETTIKETESKIKDMAGDFVIQIRQREKLLIEEVHNIYGPELMNLIEHREEMQNNLDGLKSTCALTELILKGKDIELLLLKKQVQDKLSTLSDLKVTALPVAVDKTIKFIPGMLDCGHVQDLERPLFTRLSRPRPSISNPDAMEVFYREPAPTSHASCQTDPVLPVKPPSRTVGTEYAQDMMTSTAVGTEQIETEEKAVNTRSRNSMGSMNVLSSEDNPTQTNDTTSPTPRRRRRRERPKATEVAPVETESPPEQTDSRRPRRSRFLHRDSTEDGDTFYSADMATLSDTSTSDVVETPSAASNPTDDVPVQDTTNKLDNIDLEPTSELEFNNSTSHQDEDQHNPTVSETTVDHIVQNFTEPGDLDCKSAVPEMEPDCDSDNEPKSRTRSSCCSCKCC
ncbi:E3 ubiquitin-protein ligase TRIM45-like isoform X2 [Tubulanus polymorphus]|uniref:E3 ubiquitin-protein ligase TRIM45-like isoform X2 n=1 Tax=Tubulanus polymorphus TaxID=672921 RepID=UPI003DA62D00